MLLFPKEIYDFQNLLYLERLLTDEEEQEVISFCLSMQKRGYGLTRTDFLLKSTEILQRPNREKKYNKGIPDHNWWLNFKKRHPEVTHHVQHRSYWKAHGVPLLSESKDPAQDEAKVTGGRSTEIQWNPFLEATLTRGHPLWKGPMTM